MAEDEARAAVVVVNYGSHELLADQLAAGLRSGKAADGVASITFVIVDNFSTQSERTAVEDVCRRNGWIPVLRDVNDGFGSGMNAGVAHAEKLGADTVVLVNPDAVISVETISSLVRAVREHPDTVWAPSMYRSSGQLAFAGGTLNLRRGTLSGRGLPATLGGGPASHSLPWLSGACLAMSVELWDRLGGFDDDYFMYWEDVDLTIRAHLVGAKLRVLEGAVITHDPGGTQGSSPTARPVKSPLYVRYNCRNRLIFAAKLVEPRLQGLWLLTAPAFAREVALRSGRRELLRRPALILAALRGTAEGVLYWGWHRLMSRA